MRRWMLGAAVSLGFTCIAACMSAADGEKGKWIPISDAIVKKVTEGGKIPWPGETAGVAVDPGSGDVFMIVTGNGAWRSSDHGATFARADDMKVGGRCETSFSINVDPDGRHMAYFMLDGKCAMTLDGGKTWEGMKDVGRNWDYAAVDWAGGGKNIFALRHESGGEIYLSHDAGKSWKMIGKDAKFAAVGIFGDKTLVTTKGDGVLRSEDDAQTWTKVADYTPITRVVKIYKDKAYWLAKEGMIVSRDQGATWTKLGVPVEASLGPWFKDERHWVVAGKKGLFETTDGGETWTKIAALPEKFEVPQPGWFTNIAWDAKGDVFYASQMGKQTFKLER